MDCAQGLSELSPQSPYLPPEIWRSIFELVEKVHLAAFSQVCKGWNSLIKDQLLFIPLHLKAAQALRTFSVPAQYDQMVYSEQALAFVTRTLNFYTLTIKSADGPTKQIKFDRNSEPVENISMIGKDHVGVFTSKKFALYNVHDNESKPQCSEKLPYRRYPGLSDKFSQPSNAGFAVYNKEFKSLCVYKDLTPLNLKPQQFEMPLGEIVHSIFLQTRFAVVLSQGCITRVDSSTPVTSCTSTSTSGIKKIRRAFMNLKKKPESPQSIHPTITKENVCKVYTYGFDGQSQPKEMILPEVNGKNVVVSDGHWIAVRSDHDIVILSAQTGEISHTIHVPSDGSFILKNQLLVAAIPEEEEVKLVTWSARKPINSEDNRKLSIIRLSSFIQMDLEDNLAAVVVNDKLIQFWRVTDGEKIGEINMESFGPNSPEEAFQSVSFVDRQLVIQTYQNVYFMPKKNRFIEYF